ncbi:PucR family transcriptional regulator [Nesterenkonia ebinurensis]|uniref:PucR family transcriptional regulator n=1 Tax=Nesterenkonia ebinurensis TaxID=2608252 RepID=UPI001CC7DAFC|nr:helix-turn-helix domain-containing protein [Nesterenkonia ebinurensis]
MNKPQEDFHIGTGTTVEALNHRDEQDIWMLREIADRLAADCRAIVEKVVQELRASQPEYDPVEDEELDRSVTRNVNMAVRTLAKGTALPAEDLNEGLLTGRERYEKHIAVQDVLQGFRTCFTIIHNHFVMYCEAIGVDTRTALRGSRILWAVADGFTARIVAAYRDLATESAIRDAELRTEGVRRILRGEPSIGIYQRLGLDPSHRYAAVCCSFPSGRGSTVRSRLETSGSYSGAPAQVVFEGELVVGLVSKRPEPQKDQIIGIGPFVSLSEVAGSYQVARKLLTIAQAKQLGGIYSAAEASWRLALLESPGVSAHLIDKCIAAVVEYGDFGQEIIDSVEMYFEDSCVVKIAAQRLMVHENSLRYRLRRYEEITGLRLSNPADIAEIQWALEARTLYNDNDCR